METNWKLSHVGVVVRDLDKTVEYYQSLGIAEITPEFILDNNSFTELTMYGKPADPKTKIKARFAQIGPVRFELLQPAEGESLQKEFLESRGEGIMNIAFAVDDIERETAKLVEKGIKVILNAKFKNGVVLTFFETRKVGNVIVQLIQRP